MVNSNQDARQDGVLQRSIAGRGEMFSRELHSANHRFTERIRELSAIRRIVNELKHIKDARRVFEGIIDTIIDETNAENCSLMVLDRVTGELTIKAARSQTEATSSFYLTPSRPGRKFKKGEGIAGWVAQHGETVSIPNIAQDTRFVTKTQKFGPIGSLLCLPLTIDGEIVGVVNMSHPRPNGFNDENERLMSIIADQVAIALTSVETYAQTQQLNNRLEARVNQATFDLKQANDDLKVEMAERRQAEQELVRTQRLRAAGELSAGVSHNLNNILTGIWGPAQLLQMATNDPQILKQANIIAKFAERATDLVTRLHQAVRVESESNLNPVPANVIV